MRKHKFNAKPTVVDNVRFASKKEALYYMQLKALQKAGAIVDLELQPSFPMPPTDTENHHGKDVSTSKAGCICEYRADFKYIDANRKGDWIYVDTKGYKTPEYRLKKKLMAYFYPHITVIEA